MKVTITVEHSRPGVDYSGSTQAKVVIDSDEKYRSNVVTQGLVDTTGKAVERIVTAVKR